VHTSPTAPWFIHRTRISKCLRKKIVVIFHFSLVKAAMNAPHLCKLRKHCLTGNGHGAMVHFFIFPIANDGTKTIAHLPIAVEA
jgi:hypothetical protein